MATGILCGMVSISTINYQIFYRNRPPSGWSEITSVSRFVQYSQYSPSIVRIADNHCGAVWTGTSMNSPNQRQLRFAFQDTRGMWTEPEQLTHFTIHNVNQPAIIHAGNRLHILFQGDSGGNSDLFYLSGRITTAALNDHPTIPASCRITTFICPLSTFAWTPLGSRIRIQSPGIYFILIPDHRRLQKIVVIDGKR